MSHNFYRYDAKKVINKHTYVYGNDRINLLFLLDNNKEHTSQLITKIPIVYKTY